MRWIGSKKCMVQIHKVRLIGSCGLWTGFDLFSVFSGHNESRADVPQFGRHLLRPNWWSQTFFPARLLKFSIWLLSFTSHKLALTPITSLTCAILGSANCCAVWACRLSSIFSRFLSANCTCKADSRCRMVVMSSFWGFSNVARCRLNSCAAVEGSCKARGSVVPGIASLKAAFHFSTVARVCFNCDCKTCLSKFWVLDHSNFHVKYKVSPIIKALLWLEGQKLNHSAFKHNPDA